MTASVRPALRCSAPHPEALAVVAGGGLRRPPPRGREVEFVGDESRGVHRGAKRPDRDRDLVRDGPYRRTPLRSAPRPVVAAEWRREAVAEARHRAEETSSGTPAQRVASSRRPCLDRGEVPPAVGFVQRQLPSELLVGSLPRLRSPDRRSGVHDGAPHARAAERGEAVLYI